MADLGTIVAKLGLDPSQLQSGVNQAKAALTSVGSAMGNIERQAANLFSASNIQNFAGQVDKLNNPLQAVGGRLQAIGNLGSAFSTLAAPIQQLSTEMQRAAGRADDLRDGLNGAFRDSAPAVASLIEQIGTAQGVLNDNELAAAAKTLQNLGTFSEESLRKVADVAAATGKNVDGLAEAFGRFEKFGNAKSILGLQKAIGASGQELQAFGATLDENGKLLVDTTARVDAARDALQRFTDTKFAGALAAVSDDSAKLAGEMELLKREIGASTFAMREQLDSAFLPLVQGFRQASPEVKGLVGVTAEMVGGLGGAIVPAVTLAAQLKILGFSTASFGAAIAGIQGALSTAAGAVVGLSAGIGGLILVLGSAAVGLVAYTNALNEASAAEDKMREKDLANAKALKSNQDAIGKSAEELQKMGKTSKDLVPVLQGLQDQLMAARNVDPSSTTTKALEAKVRDFKKVQSELAKAELKTKEAPPIPGGVEKSVQSQAAADEKARKERKAADDKERRDRATAEENHRKELLDIALDEIKRKSAAREIDKGQEIAALQEVLKTAKATASERRDIEQQIANLTGQIKDKAAADDKTKSDKAKQQAKQDADQIREVKKAALDQQIKEAELAIKQLDDQEKRGADVTIRRQAELAKKVAAEKAKIDLAAEADKLKTNDGGLKAKITKQAKGDKYTVDKEAAAEAEKISKARKDSALQDREDELSFDLDIQARRIAAMKQLAEAGQISSSQIKSALEQQLALQLQLIEAQKQQALAATTDASKIAQANKRAEIQTAEAKASTRKEIEATTQALRAQQEQQKSATSLNLGGGQQSLEEFFKSQEGFFDITKSKSTTSKDFKSLAEQQALLRTLDKSPLSKSATDARASIPFNRPGDIAGRATNSATAAASQTVSSVNNYNSVNGTSIDDPALSRKIEDIVGRVIKTDRFKAGA